MSILFKNARILKMDDTPIFLGDLVVDGNRISYIGENGEKFGPFNRVIDCQKNLLMPGFKNAHTHSAMTFVRSKTDNYNLQDWLFKIIFPREACLTREDVYNCAKVAYLEYLTSGITACFDQYFFPDMSAEAAEDIGMRITLVGTYNAKYYSCEEIKNLYHLYNDPKDSLVRYTLGFHAEYTMDDNELAMMKALVQELKTPFFAHVSETATEVESCKAKRGVSPVQFLLNEGLYDFGGGAYHCVYFDENDEKIFKDHNLIVVTCPGSNSKLASGIAPIAKYLKDGLNIAIGTDGPASNNSLDMFKEMTLLYSFQKVVNKDPTCLDPYQILKMATVNGAKAIGLKDADILEVGKLADIIMIDLSRPNMQPINNIVSNLVFSGSKENIKLTMIDGKILYENGSFFVGEPIEDIYRKCQEVTDRIDNDLAKAN